jgi:hypothetical protein
LLQAIRVWAETHIEEVLEAQQKYALNAAAEETIAGN